MSLSTIMESLPNISNSPVQLGAIKIGGKSKQIRKSRDGKDWRPPVKFDHFQIMTMNRDAQGDYIPDVALMDELIEKYGDSDGKLRKIPIRVMSDDIDDVIQSAFVWYSGKRCGARSDGKELTWYYNTDGQPFDPPIVEPWTLDRLDMKLSNGAPMFKLHSNFNCVISANTSRWGGVYKFRTTSIISFKQLASSILHLTQLTGGVLMGMPLMLVMRPMQVSPGGKTTTVHVVHVELHGADLAQLQQQALDMVRLRLTLNNQVTLATRQYRKLLTAPGTEPEEEAESIQTEYQPEENADDFSDVSPSPGNGAKPGNGTSALNQAPKPKREKPGASANVTDAQVIDTSGTQIIYTTGEVIEAEPDHGEPKAAEPVPAPVDEVPPMSVIEQRNMMLREVAESSGVDEAKLAKGVGNYLLALGKKGKLDQIKPEAFTALVEMVEKRQAAFA